MRNILQHPTIFLFMVLCPVLGLSQNLQVNLSAFGPSCHNGSDGSIMANPINGTPPYSYSWSNGMMGAAIGSLSAGSYEVTVTDANQNSAVESANLQNPQPLTWIINSNFETCDNASDATASVVSVQGGTPPYSYEWSTGETTQTVSGLTAGTYSVIIEDANNCSAIGYVEIEVSPEGIWLMPMATDALCFGDQNGSVYAGVMTGTPPFSYAWSDPALPDTSTITNLLPGTYSVTVTDANGCTGLESGTVAEPDQLIVTLTSNNINCASGLMGSIIALADGGTPDYSYLWSNGTTGPVIQDLPSGSYSVTVTDANDCSISAEALINVADSIELVLSASFETCPGAGDGAVLVDSIIGGVAPYTYQWEGLPDTTALLTGLSEGTYIVTVTDAMGCSAVDSATVVISPEGLWVMSKVTDVSCPDAMDGSIEVNPMTGTPPYTYAWDPPSLPPSVFVDSLGPGTYFVTVTDANGCTGMDTALITEPEPLMVDLMVTNTNCIDNTVGSVVSTVTGGTPPYAYLWNTGDTTSNLMDIMPGVYSLTVTDSNGCTGVATDTVDAISDLIWNVSGIDATCAGACDGVAQVNSVSNGVPPYTFMWNTGDTTAVIDSLCPGEYIVVIEDSLGCFGIGYVQVGISGLAIDIASTDILCAGDDDGTLTVTPSNGTAPYDYNWSIQAPNDSILTDLPPGTYTVTVTDANGCSAVDSATVVAPLPIAIELSGMNSDCGSQGTGSASAVVSGGTSPYSYLWSNGETTPDIDSLSAGTYVLSVTDDNGCLAVDSISIQGENPFAGTVSITADALCLIPSNAPAVIEAIPDGAAVIPPGYELIYILTMGPGQVIIDTSSTPVFSVSSGDVYSVHPFVYDPNTFDFTNIDLGITTLSQLEALLVSGGGDICADLDTTGDSIDVDAPQAGTLTADADEVCLTGSSVVISATLNGDQNVPAGYEIAFVLTSGPGLLVESVSSQPSFTITEGGLYTIHTLVYDPNTLDLSLILPGTPAVAIFALLVPGGGDICADLDVAGAPIFVENPDAGTLTPDVPSVCLVDGMAMISATLDGNQNVPAGYETAFVLTQGMDLIIVSTAASPNFTVNTGGLYTIHTLVYDPATLDLNSIIPGTPAADVLALLVPGGGDICADLDVNGASIIVDNPDAGTLTADADEACLVDGQAIISATPDGNQNIPPGFQAAYVLTQGTDLLIVTVSADPVFTVNEGGLFTIHTLVYDPNTLDLTNIPVGTPAADVFALLVPGGGDICADLDVGGAPVVVDDPDAGTLTADATDVCLIDGSADLSATPNGDQVVPAGYEVLYVLTQGPGLVIVDANADPEFTVDSTGLYTLHTLVYDPNTLDPLIVINFGVTTGAEVFALLAPGGGAICADLDVAGAPINVGQPEAGTVTADSDTVCLDMSVTISASSNGDSLLLPGFTFRYLLVDGSGVILDINGTGTFVVNAGGNYTIHALAFDPAGFDPGTQLDPGVTTVNDLLNLLAGVCADLDLTGAMITVEDPDAGTLTADSDVVCLVNGMATLSATPDGNANVPSGYEVLYVLTQGTDLTIINAGSDPQFMVDQNGLYTIHTLVYNPNTLDPLSVIDFGTTTGAEVFALLVPGGGAICADLDVAGAPVEVVGPVAGDVSPVDSSICFTTGAATISALPAGNSIVPTGFMIRYLLVDTSDQTIVSSSGNPVFTIFSGGVYAIHVLVHDPNTLPTSAFAPGTSVLDLYSMLTAGGGDICADLNLNGAVISVEDPDAGTIEPDQLEVCLFFGDTVTISGTVDVPSTVPAGYELLYVLTQGNDRVIQAADTVPAFEVFEFDTYRLHTLVYNPSTLDLSFIELGVTTGQEVFDTLSPGGGDICGDLRLPAPPIHVIPCDTCLTIGDRVWFDFDQDGLQDQGEFGVPNFPVALMQAGPDGIFNTPDDVMVTFTNTNAFGVYLFDCVEPGDYQIFFPPTALPDSSEFTLANVGNNDEIDSDADPVTGRTPTFTIIADQDDDFSFDAGIDPPCIDVAWGGQIGFNQTVCAGIMPDTLVSLSAPSGGFGPVEFLWMYTTVPGPFSQSSWIPIPNSNTPFYKPGPLFQTTYFIRCVRAIGCDEFVKESNIVKITVIPYDPAICPPLLINMVAQGQTNGGATVSWMAKNEMDNLDYYIERSGNGQDFMTIGEVKGKRNGANVNTYTFEDLGTRVGSNYYRVRVENHGHFIQYSDVAMVMIDKSEVQRLTVFPNPFASEVQVASNGRIPDGGIMEVFSATGQLIATHGFREGDQVMQTLDFGSQPQGLYILRVTYEDTSEPEVYRLVKVSQ